MKERIKSVAILLLLLIGIFLFSMLHTEKPPVETVLKILNQNSPKPMIIVIDRPVEVIECKKEISVDYTINDAIPLESTYQLKAQICCENHNVPYAFFLAICESESTFNPDAVGDNGKSIGLMQIHKPNWNKYGLDAALPFDNIEIGVRMLSELIEKYGNIDCVVMAYKGGESAANEWIAKGVRLKACDEIADRFDYWEQQIGD